MSTQPGFVDYVFEQAGLGERLTAKRMFGEYGLYVDGRVVAFACDDSLFVKPAEGTAALCAELPRRPPYPGAKDYPVADEWLDDGERLRELLLATFAAVGDGKAAKKVRVPAPSRSPKPAKSPKAAKTAKPATQKARTSAPAANGPKRALAPTPARAPKKAP